MGDTVIRRGSSIPAGVDYDTWAGPPPCLPFSENRFHYLWRWHGSFGADIGNHGVHQPDMARWALGVGMPRQIGGMGRKLIFDDDQQTPGAMNLVYHSGGKLPLFETTICNPYGKEDLENVVAVHGSSGALRIGRRNRRWGFEILYESGREDDSDSSHARDFLDCVKGGMTPNADFETGRTSTALRHLGNIAARTGRAPKLVRGKETGLDDAAADCLLGRQYRGRWTVPKDF